ncbi:PREDICTED: neuronal acetylcholine receptor subunit beta-3-like, partial [Rhagoletis zephyria]|uniref:neuronal acetylcholine receptor subunit beta-3-like n=1 Tax=Rhagoletis zephyria TaxID=28612 RepID=UPI0008112E6D
MRLTLTLLVLGLSCRLCNGKKENDTVVQNHIKALRKELFKDRGYDIMSRPVLNYSHPTDVHIWLDLNYIVDLDLRTGVLTTEGWLRLWWVDEQLRWRPDEFGGIVDIRVTAGEVFRPDIVLLNSVQPENIIRTNTHSDLLLYESGHLVWVPALSMRTVCAELDLSEWPTDRQSCEYHFASWTYEGSSLNLVNAFIYIGQMIILVAFSLLWSSVAFTLSTMNSSISPR